MKKGANLSKANTNERQRARMRKLGYKRYNKEDSLDRELTSNRLVLNARLRHHGEDSMTLDWEEFDSIPDIGDIEK